MPGKINVTTKLTSFSKPTDYIAILMDASGSMAPFESRAFEVLQEQDTNIKKLMEDPNRETIRRYYAFNFICKEISTSLVRQQYRAGGGTALYDSIGKAIDDLSLHDIPGHDRSFLVVVVTDGQESGVSRFQGLNSISNLIQVKQLKGNWTFVILGPYGCKEIFVKMGVPKGNIEEWDAGKSSEYDRISGSTVSATQSYNVARADGARQTRCFFKPDLSTVTVAKVKSQLSEVTANYKRVAVPKESRIDVFAAYHTGKDYVPGTVYYPLTKTEKVRPGVALLLREKGTKEVFGGDVRGVLGLQQTGEIRVEPGNHANWDIFIQSESTIRLLVRGTQVLIKQ